MGNQQRQLFVPGPLNSPKALAFRQLSVSFSCYPFSLTRFGATDQTGKRDTRGHKVRHDADVPADLQHTILTQGIYKTQITQAYLYDK